MFVSLEGFLFSSLQLNQMSERQLRLPLDKKVISQEERREGGRLLQMKSVVHLLGVMAPQKVPGVSFILIPPIPRQPDRGLVFIKDHLTEEFLSFLVI